MPQLYYPSRFSRAAQTAAPNVYRIPTGISNAYFVALDADAYILIDAGPTGFGQRILDRAAELFPTDRPRAILLTHAHFDHAGGLPELLARWPDVPVYAHPLEMPYLNGNRHYPPGDPTVGGTMAQLARFMDTSRPTPVGKEVRPYPAGSQELDVMPGWILHPSPGHTPGHVSFYDPIHRILIAGDAVTTLNQNRPIASLTQKPMIATPPPYATYDWVQAKRSFQTLAGLQPYYLCTGHGVPMQGPEIAEALADFAREFPTPRHGRYVQMGATFDCNGPTYIPPPAADRVKQAALAAAGVGTVAAGYALYRVLRQRSSSARAACCR